MVRVLLALVSGTGEQRLGSARAGGEDGERRGEARELCEAASSNKMRRAAAAHLRGDGMRWDEIRLAAAAHLR